MMFNNGGTLYSGTPGSTCVFGGFVNRGGAPSANTVIQSSIYLPATDAATGATSGIGNTLSPTGSRVPCVIWPTSAYAPQVASGTNLNIYMLDLRGYPGEIAGVFLQFIPTSMDGTMTNAAGRGTAQVMMVDNVNKFVYGTATNASNTQQAIRDGMGISFAVFLKDNSGV